MILRSFANMFNKRNQYSLIYLLQRTFKIVEIDKNKYLTLIPCVALPLHYSTPSHVFFSNVDKSHPKMCTNPRGQIRTDSYRNDVSMNLVFRKSFARGGKNRANDL